MRDYKKVLVAGALAMSILVGQASPSTAYAWEQFVGSPIVPSDEDDNDDTENTKTEEEYTDISLYNETGEVLLFADEYEGSFGGSGEMYKCTLHREGITSKPVLNEYIVVNKSRKKIKNYGEVTIVDGTKSVKKVVLDGKKSYKLKKVHKVKKSAGWSDIWVDYDRKRLYEKIGYRDVKGLCLQKLSEGRHTVSMTDKHGHKITMKVWVDSKAPKIKVTKKSNKFVVKVTDKNSGVREIGVRGMKYIKLPKSKRTTSYTFNITKDNCKKYSYYRKHGFDKHFVAADRTGNCQRGVNSYKG